jgi:DNA (cytosine-5)-methyltransferase 1
MLSQVVSSVNGMLNPNVGRVANGIPARAHRLKRWLGNAVVPQIPELIGRAILAAEAA